MSIQLPSSIAAFFEADNAADAERAAQCFARDAVVRDEGHTHQAQQAILSWLLDAHAKYEYIAEPLRVSEDGTSVTVLARLTGNFPGSPAELEYLFKLADDKINALEIH